MKEYGSGSTLPRKAAGELSEGCRQRILSRTSGVGLAGFQEDVRVKREKKPVRGIGERNGGSL